MAQTRHKLKGKQKLSFHAVGANIPIDRTDGAFAGEVANEHVIIWSLYESPRGDLTATQHHAGTFNTSPATFPAALPGHYTVFLAHFDTANNILQVYSQGPHGVA